MSLEGTINRPPHEDGHSESGVRPAADALAYHAGTALIVGGLLWVATYVVEILIGVLLGEAAYNTADVNSSWLIWSWPATFVAAILFLATGVLGVAVRIGRRSRLLVVLGGGLACVAIGASVINLVGLAGVTGEPAASNQLGFLGVIGMLGGSVLVGAGALRSRALARRPAMVLALLPLAFVPAILLSIPLEQVAPDYAVADFPFPIVGLVLAWVGVTLRGSRH